MNILHINDKIAIKGGVEVYLEQLMDLLPEYGCTPHWLGIHHTGGAYTVERYSQGVPVKTLVSRAELLRYLEGYVSAHAIQLIHVHSLSNPELLRCLFELGPVVRSMHEPRMICPGQGKFWRYSESVCTQAFGRHCLYHAYKEGCCNRHPKRLWSAYQNTRFETTEGVANYQSVVVMSEYMRAEASLLGFPETQLQLNPYFTPVVPGGAIMEQTARTNQRIIFIGRLSRTKGVHYFIEAAQRLLPKHDNLHFDIVGSGHDEAYFKSLVPKSQEGAFTFHGWQDRAAVNQLLQKAYLLAFPSIYPEAFGITGIEAMMRGKPVVGFDVGGVTTWLKDGETGFAVSVKDVDRFAERLALLLTDTALYERMSRTARQVALVEFTPAIHLQKLKEIYEKAIS